ncbi:MAG: type I glyceraldehyde-3-phosphate dehydrogenase [Flavobacteriales bacterium]|nr:type I glyceraldehyde-3-phosphate dehydrogenase [Flavobacteriales bacterium]
MRIGINGFGRIGRTVARLLMKDPSLELVAINDLADAKAMSHLFKYDSVHGRYSGEVIAHKNEILIDGRPVKYSSHSKPEDIPWGAMGVDIVIEATGKFLRKSLAEAHVSAGAKRVLLTAPSQDDSVKSIVIGVNEQTLDKSDVIVSNASCTTNSAAPMVKILNDLCGIESCYITTVHSYTTDQHLQDAPHRDLRRGRAAAESIVPTTTGAAKALTRIFPELSDVLGGCGIRVPVPDGSLTDLTCIVKRPQDIGVINRAFFTAAQGGMKGVLDYTEDPIVSRDVLGDPHSCIFDAQLTSVIGSMVKVVGWYDNEIGYSHRLIDLLHLMNKN